MLRHIQAWSLKTTLCFFLSGLFLPPANAASEFDVVIVGAGMSGVAAGKRLKEHGFTVVLLEARNYVGGRIRTISLDGTPLDLGASFVEGTQQNPIFDLVQQFKLPYAIFNWDNNRVFNTFSLPFKEITPAQYTIIDNLSNAMYKKIEALQNAGLSNQVSLAQGLAPWIASVSVQTRLLVNFVIGAEIENDYAADIRNLSLNHFNQDDEALGGTAIMTQGYSGLINAMLQKSNLDIRLQHIVSSISYNQKGGTVVTNKGIFKGKWVICTVPLGILKLPKGASHSIEFIPALPAEKLAAIKRLQMGVLDRTILVFPSSFWLNTLLHEKPLINRVPLSKEQGQWIETINLTSMLHKPILAAFNAGSVARNFEKQEDHQVVDSLMTFLRSIYGQDIPNPIAYKVTHWGKDTFSFGSYSHLPPGANANDYTILGQPVQRLRFAGEATIRSYPSSVRGAYISGVREANRIIKEGKG